MPAADQAIYQEVVALFRAGKNDPLIFDTTAAQVVVLDAETESLLAHHKTATAFAIGQAEENVAGKSRLLSFSCQVRLLEGKCADGKIDGLFDAVAQYQFSRQHSFGTQNVSVTKRVKGEMRNGKLEGPLTVVEVLSSAMGGNRTTSWCASRVNFSGNERVGTEMHYSEHPQFNSLQVVRDRPNGLRQVRTYAGSELSTVYDSFEEKIYGFLDVYNGGARLSRSCLWGNKPVADSVGYQYLAGNHGRQAVTRIGAGIFFPTNASGPFVIEGISPDGPAAQAGLLPGDTVLAIGGKMLTALDDVHAYVRLLQGAEGTAVEIQFLRDGENAPRTVTVTRGPFRMVQLEPAAE